jgi:hypothetical protein
MRSIYPYHFEARGAGAADNTETYYLAILTAAEKLLRRMEMVSGHSDEDVHLYRRMTSTPSER